MAETLSVTDMLPNKFEPKRDYRWVLAIEGIDSFLVNATKRPSITIGNSQIKFINSYRQISNGKGVFGSISVVMEWIRTHYESVSGRAGYTDFLKRDLQLKMLDPIGTVIELWDIKGALITSADFGGLGYDNDGIMKIALTLEVDNCVLQF
jgi:hypothetical protein